MRTVIVLKLGVEDVVYIAETDEEPVVRKDGTREYRQLELGRVEFLELISTLALSEGRVLEKEESTKEGED